MEDNELGGGEVSEYVTIEFEAYWDCPKCQYKNSASFGVEQYESLECRGCSEWFKAANEFNEGGDW